MRNQVFTSDLSEIKTGSNKSEDQKIQQEIFFLIHEKNILIFLGSILFYYLKLNIKPHIEKDSKY